MAACFFITDLPRTEPRFDDDKAEIIEASKCVSLVVMEESQGEGRVKKFNGTAFWVAPNLLLTAGHNTVGVNGPFSHIRVTVPGCLQVQLWQVGQQNINLIECKVVGTIYKRNGPHTRDIAILDSVNFHAGNSLRLSSSIPEIHSVVDVIGYPATIKHEWIEAHKGVRNFEQGQREAERLLPRGRLTVTRGKLESTGSMLPYSMSTCPGMSGSCVLYKGKVIGKLFAYGDLSKGFM